MVKRLFIFSGLLLFSLLTFSQKNLTLEDNRQYTVDLNDIWGYVDTANNEEYALVGLRDGVSIVNVTQPDSIYEVIRTFGPSSTWRDIKTWNQHAYVTNEEDSGLYIIDLSYLPDSVKTYRWSAQSYSSAHDIYIDENGVGYILGANDNMSNGGAIMIDIAANPTNPPVLGNYSQNYIHDAFVRGDTIWGAEVYQGWFSVVDVSNKSNPQVLATQSTPSDFTHNCWLSDDGQYLFTTDEVSDAYIGAYDVSNLSNIQEVDRYQSKHSSGVIPHNTFYHNGFLVTSYYRDGVTVVDANRPHNLIETGFYDTSPMSGDGFNGAWGVYPFLPSGTVIVSDIEQGLFVFSPNYEKGCYLEGTVTDSATNSPINNAKVEIQSPTKTDFTDPAGDYATGVADSGSYTVKYSKAGYKPKTFSNIVLDNGVLTIQDVKLVKKPTFSVVGQILRKSDSSGIPNAKVLIINDDTSYSTTTDATGNFNFSAIYQDTFSIYSAKWGFMTTAKADEDLNAGNSSFKLYLGERIYDDYTFDLGWSVNSTASTGMWVREEPLGTTYNSSQANPDFDVSNDFTDKCYITGNGGGSGGDDDIDGGTTILTSPTFDLSDANTALISYSRWFYNAGGFGPENDSLIVKVTNGSETIVLEKITPAQSASNWVDKNIRIFGIDSLSPSLPFTANMQVIFEAGDYGGGHIVEAGVDRFYVSDSTIMDSTGSFITENSSHYQMQVYPNPVAQNLHIIYNLNTTLEDHAELQILDHLGRVVHRMSLHTPRAELTWHNDLSPGVYFVRIKNGEQQSMPKKIVKIR